jgi:small subunit ribosomal protein S7
VAEEDVDTETEEEELAHEEPEPVVPMGPDAEGSSIGDYLFDRWDPTEITIEDRGLARYVNLSGQFSVHTGARHANEWFGKSEVNIVERLANQLMRTEEYTGKKTKAIGVIEDAFEHIADETDDNPLQILVDALQNAAPREEVTRLRYGGISVPKAVDTAPSRRVDWALRNLTQGTLQSSYKNTTPVHLCLAQELLDAANDSQDSYAVNKKNEVERVAGSAR